MHKFVHSCWERKQALVCVVRTTSVHLDDHFVLPDEVVSELTVFRKLQKEREKKKSVSSKSFSKNFLNRNRKFFSRYPMH